jgi:hypothetical protein
MCQGVYPMTLLQTTHPDFVSVHILRCLFRLHLEAIIRRDWKGFPVDWKTAIGGPEGFAHQSHSMTGAIRDVIAFMAQGRQVSPAPGVYSRWFEMLEAQASSWIHHHSDCHQSNRAYLLLDEGDVFCRGQTSDLMRRLTGKAILLVARIATAFQPDLAVHDIETGIRAWAEAVDLSAINRLVLGYKT